MATMAQNRSDSGMAAALAAQSRPGEDGAASLETRQRIVETAERLFRQYGYQKTTVADIAGQLSMSPANVYRFFASKAAIIEAVAMLLTGEIEAVGRAAAAAKNLSVRARLSRLIHETHAATVQRCMADKRMHAMVRAAIEESWGVVRAHKANMMTIVAGLVAEGAANGEFEVRDAGLAALCFQNAFIAMCHPQIIEHCLQGGENVADMIDPMLAFCFRGMGAKEPPA